LAKELGKSVAELAEVLTPEELTGWAAYFEIKSEEESRAIDRAKQNSRARGMQTR